MNTYTTLSILNARALEAIQKKANALERAQLDKLYEMMMWHGSGGMRWKEQAEYMVRAQTGYPMVTGDSPTLLWCKEFEALAEMMGLEGEVHPCWNGTEVIIMQNTLDNYMSGTSGIQRVGVYKARETPPLQAIKLYLLMRPGAKSDEVGENILAQ